MSKKVVSMSFFNIQCSKIVFYKSLSKDILNQIYELQNQETIQQESIFF